VIRPFNQSHWRKAGLSSRQQRRLRWQGRFIKLHYCEVCVDDLVISSARREFAQIRLTCVLTLYLYMTHA
jgi:hypothetical protein